MPDNIVKFDPGRRKKPAATAAPRQPSLVTAVVVAVVAIAIVGAIMWWFGAR